MYFEVHISFFVVAKCSNTAKGFIMENVFTCRLVNMENMFQSLQIPLSDSDKGMISHLEKIVPEDTMINVTVTEDDIVFKFSVSTDTDIVHQLDEIAQSSGFNFTTIVEEHSYQHIVTKQRVDSSTSEDKATSSETGKGESAPADNKVKEAIKVIKKSGLLLLGAAAVGLTVWAGYCVYKKGN